MFFLFLDITSCNSRILFERGLERELFIRKMIGLIAHIKIDVVKKMNKSDVTRDICFV